MDEQDEEVRLLLNRTRAARERLNAKMNANDVKGARSPLKDKNSLEGQTSPMRSRSPIKTTYSSPSKSSLSVKTTQSPIRTGTFKINRREDDSISPSRSTAYTRVYESKDGSNRSEENYNRDCTEKKTTIIDGVPDSGNYTKTTITEREETIEKKEYIKFTENAGALRNKSPSKILEEHRAKRDQEINKNEKIVIDLAKKTDETRSLGSPSRFGSCRDNVVEEVFSSPIRQSRLNLATASPSTSKIAAFSVSPVKSSALKDDNDTEKPKKREEKVEKKNEIIDDEDDGSFKYGQRKRLNALASKFSNYEEEDSDSMKQVLAQASATGSPYKRDLTKTVDVDAIINRTAPPTHNLNSDIKDPDFVQSLKAQGFEESNSKSKLVYDFKRKTVGNDISTPNRSRDASPYKNDPLQYIRPQPKVVTNTASVATPPKLESVKPSSPSKKTPAYRSVSPTRMASPRTEASTSVKPHPLQFVSPQKAKVAAATQEGPPKPIRTYINMEADSPPEVLKNEQVIQVNVEKSNEDRTDTASRRSIVQKKSLWESSEDQNNTPDPALLPLSQRMAKFEKMGSVPKPIARFGEPITPAMLAKTNTATSNFVPASEPAWKRQKRDRSPNKLQPFLTPGNGNLQRKVSFEDSGTPALKSRGNIDTKKNLFENNWKHNDIARGQEENKRKDLEICMNRFKKPNQSDDDHERDRSRSPQRRSVSPTHQRIKSPVKISPAGRKNTTSPKKSPVPQAKSPEEKYYPGVNSLPRVKVSPPRAGQLYPDLTDIHDERPETSMSGESFAPSEAPSLGTAIKRAASANRRHSPMKAIAEDTTSDDDEGGHMDSSGVDDEINDILDEALDESQGSEQHISPKRSRERSSPSATSAASWEFQTPVAPSSSSSAWLMPKDYKTPRIDQLQDSPQAELPYVETEDGTAVPASNLLHSVSVYRKQKPAGLNVNVKNLGKLVKQPEEVDDDSMNNGMNEDRLKEEIRDRINKLQEEENEQTQRRSQASKALALCEQQNEFEGSYERVEFERLLLEAYHKHKAASQEIKRLKDMVAQRQFNLIRGKTNSKGSISISGITLPLKKDFVKLMNNPGHGGDDYVHYFVCLVKYRSQVIATQMLSSIDGINRSGQLVFTNLLNINDLDFDFRIYLEVYGLQTPKEVLSHEDKYHIKKDHESMFNLLTPLKQKLKKSKTMTPASNPVNALNIRKSKFGLVGYTKITIETLKDKTFQLEEVPSRSPLDGHLFMRLNVHSESHISKKGFLTFQAEKGGYGDWQRRWCVFKDNTLYFWKYPEDEEKQAPIEHESISLHNCTTEIVGPTPREVCSRQNTYMLKCRRSYKNGDIEGLNTRVDRKNGITYIRHLVSADSRDGKDGRLEWCKVLNDALHNMRSWDPKFMKESPTSDSVSTSSMETDDNVSSASTDIW